VSLQEPTTRATASSRQPSSPGVIRELGLGLITGAAADDPSAIGTYAAAGAKLGPGFLWTAPATFPMMFAVVYLSAKLGQVTGKGLFAVIRDAYPNSLLRVLLGAVLIGNTIEAAADLGGMAASLTLLVPLPIKVLVIAIAVVLLGLQILGSYTLIRNVCRWLSLSLLAYVGAAFLSRPDWSAVMAGSLVPKVEFSCDSSNSWSRS